MRSGCEAPREVTKPTKRRQSVAARSSDSNLTPCLGAPRTIHPRGVNRIRSKECSRQRIHFVQTKWIAQHRSSWVSATASHPRTTHQPRTAPLVASPAIADDLVGFAPPQSALRPRRATQADLTKSYAHAPPKYQPVAKRPCGVASKDAAALRLNKAKARRKRTSSRRSNSASHRARRQAPHQTLAPRDGRSPALAGGLSRGARSRASMPDVPRRPRKGQPKLSACRAAQRTLRRYAVASASAYSFQRLPEWAAIQRSSSSGRRLQMA